MIVCPGQVLLLAAARYATAYARAAIACVIMTAVMVSLSASAARADDPARQLYDAAGLQTWLQQVPAGLADAFESAPHIDPELKPAIRALIERHFPIADLRQNALDGLTAAMSEDQMQAVTAFLDEPLGQRATEMEVAAQQPGLADMVMHEGTRIWRDLDDRGAERAEIYQRIAASTRAVELAVTFGMNVSYALLSGMMAAPGSPLVMTDDEVLEMVNALEPDLRAEVVASTFAELAYTYRDLSLGDLRAYAEFLETPDARTFYLSQEDVLRRFMLNRIGIFGREVMDLLSARRT